MDGRPSLARTESRDGMGSSGTRGRVEEGEKGREGKGSLDSRDTSSYRISTLVCLSWRWIGLGNSPPPAQARPPPMPGHDTSDARTASSVLQAIMCSCGDLGLTCSTMPGRKRHRRHAQTVRCPAAKVPSRIHPPGEAQRLIQFCSATVLYAVKALWGIHALETPHQRAEPMGSPPLHPQVPYLRPRPAVAQRDALGCPPT